MSLLEIRCVYFTAGGKPILENLNFTLGEGEIHALIGTNGTGKSTLARLVMGCEGYHIGSGEIRFDGLSINELPIEKRAGLGITMVWQEPARFEGITVRDYLSLGKRGSDLSDCLDSVGLASGDYLDRMLDNTMSGGERKRIELASMLALKPRLCILDEPISGIDLVSVKDIVAVIRRIQQNGSSVLLISHREEIASVADRASLLCGGRIAMTGDPDTIVRDYKSRHCVICNGQICDYATH